MKTFKSRVLVVVVFMLGTLFTYANDVVSDDIIGAKKVKVIFENVEKGQLLTVKDYQDHILYQEHIFIEGDFVKVFDFSHLEEGNYKIEVDKKSETVTKFFELKLNTVIFKEETTSAFHKPFIKNDGDMVMISRINFDKKPMSVSIYYKDEIILNEKVHSLDVVAQKVYKLNDSKKGNYRVVVRNNGKSFVSKFSI